MALNDLYRLIDRQTLLGQEVLNVYYYKQSTAAGSSIMLMEAFFADVVAPMLPLQSNALTHTRIDVENLTGVVDYVEQVLLGNNIGTNTGEALPPFVCYGIRWNRASRLSRHGYKRIAGVTETTQNGGGLVSTFDDEMATLVTAMQTPVTEDTGPSGYTPVIVRKTGSAPNYTYDDFEVGSCQFTGITSQVSRKYGRGS